MRLALKWFIWYVIFFRIYVTSTEHVPAAPKISYRLNETCRFICKTMLSKASAAANLYIYKLQTLVENFLP
jgi:hypothetical protein